MTYLLLLAHFFVFMPAAALGGGCDRALLKGIDFVDPEKQPVPLDFCNNPEGIQAKVLRALDYLDAISDREFLPGLFDQGILGGSPFQYFKKQVRFVLPLQCSMPAQRNDEDSIIVCPSFADYDSLTQAEILVHEARHQDGGNHHKHVVCGSQAIGLEGKLGCDDRYEDKGSYAASAEFYLKLSRADEGGSLTGAVKRVARLRALYYLNCRMNKPFTKLNGGPVSCRGLPSSLPGR